MEAFILLQFVLIKDEICIEQYLRGVERRLRAVGATEIANKT
jgi:hypothetical protein